MSLLTLERSSPSPHESENEDLLSCSSYEGFVATEHFAMCLSPRPWASLGRHIHGEQLRIFAHLKKVMKELRQQDALRLAVELENMTVPYFRNVTKYLVIVSTTGRQDTEETIVLGTEQEGSMVRLCLVLPLWRDTEIKLDGDGGFSVHTGDRHAIFKPSSVQSMWTALQVLYKATEMARLHNYYVGGLSHTWMYYYESQLTSNWAIRNEWNLMEDVESFRPDSPIYSGGFSDNMNDDKLSLKKVLVHQLRDVMLHVDLEEVTSKQLRLRLEEEMKMDLKEYRGFLDQQMLRILGQMERPSEIFEYLYLGSEWNASNLVELKELGVGCILNITREIDNFYPEVFKYLNIRLYDVPESELMKHWDKTYQFIKEAKDNNTKVLVHCKMGISRSAATVMAYAMKEYDMPLEEAIAFVKEKRNVVNPNEGFVKQLRDYEGILKARHNQLWGKKAPSRLKHSDKKRFFSDPNLLHTVQLECPHEDEIELPFLAEDDDLPPILELGSSGMKHTPQGFSMNSLPLHYYSTPLDKATSIRNFLASLPNLPQTIDDDQGIGGEHVCTSESGSGYSSPILTPPEEDNLPTLYRLAKEVHEDMTQMLDSEEENNPREEKPPSFLPTITTTNITTHPASTIITTQSPPPVVLLTVSITETNRATSPQPSSSPGRQQPIASGIVPFHKTLRSASLPHNVIYTTKISPNSSKASLSSLGQNTMGMQQQDSESRSSSRLDSTSPMVNGHPDCDCRSESPMELAVPPMQHRRTKSDCCNMSGPVVKTAQIFSVPDRIKEIEELHVQTTKGPSLEGEEKPVDFFIGSSSSPSSRPSARRSSVSSGSRSSSEESLHSCHEVVDPLSPVKSPRISTRHSSLSPKPSVVKNLTPHLALQSSMSLPPNVAPPEIDIDSLSVSSELKSDEDIALSLQGAVRARVLDIEERNKDGTLKVSSRKTSSSASLEKAESLAKSCSPPPQRRPSSDLQGKTVRVADSPERSTLPFKRPSRLTHRRPSSDTIMMTRPRSVMAEAGTSSLQSSSNRFMSVEDIPLEMGSVKELKRKFEDTEGSKKPSRKFKANLRRAQSLRDIDSPRTKSHGRRKFVSSTKVDSMERHRTSSPRPEYITTLPPEPVSRDVEDFQTTLIKFTVLTSSVQ